MSNRSVSCGVDCHVHSLQRHEPQAQLQDAHKAQALDGGLGPVEAWRLDEAVDEEGEAHEQRGAAELREPHEEEGVDRAVGHAHEKAAEEEAARGRVLERHAPHAPGGAGGWRRVHAE